LVYNFKAQFSETAQVEVIKSVTVSFTILCIYYMGMQCNCLRPQHRYDITIRYDTARNLNTPFTRYNRLSNRLYRVNGA